MKNFTKVMLSFAAMLVFIGASMAQPWDVSVSQIDGPVAGSKVNTVLEFPIDIRFMNNSASAIPGGTQVEVDFYANGTPISGSPVTGFSLPSAGLAGGADIGFNGLNFRFNVTPFNGNVRICYGVRVVGNTDPNPANDTLCAYYQMESGTTVELGISDLGIVVPSVAPGGKLGANGESIQEMTVTITNNGDFTYPSGYGIPYSLYIQGEPANSVTGVLTADLSPGGNTVRQITNTSVIPFLPESGPFTICASVVLSGDANSANNETCEDYVSAVGIEELAPEFLSNIYFNNSSKVLEVAFSNEVKGNVNLVITNTSGQTVRNISVNAKGQKEQIDLSNVSNGLYVISMYGNSGEVESKKFVVN